MEIFFPKEIYREPRYIKQVLGNCVGSSWLMRVPPPHTLGLIWPLPFLCNTGEMLGTPSLIALQFQFKDWAACPGHREVPWGPRATNTVPILFDLFSSKSQSEVAWLIFCMLKSSFFISKLFWLFSLFLFYCNKF